MSGSISMAVVSGESAMGSTKAPRGAAKPQTHSPEIKQQKKKIAEPKQKPAIRPKSKPTRKVRAIPVKKKSNSKVQPSPMEKVAPSRAIKKTNTVRQKDVPHTNQQASPKRIHQEIKKPAPASSTSTDNPVNRTNPTNYSPGHAMHRAQSAGGEGVAQGPIHAQIGSLYGPKIVHWTRPQYPRKARAKGRTGLVVLRITIDSSGHPTRIEVLREAGFGFDEAAIKAIKKSSFTPATHNGHPVACIALLPVHFNLKGN